MIFLYFFCFRFLFCVRRVNRWSIDYVDVCKEAIEYNSSSDEDRSNDSEYVYKQPFDIIDSSEEDKSINSINVCKKIVRDNSSSDEQQTQNDEVCIDT